MRTRIVEIPLCDLCNRDGVPYAVTMVGGGGGDRFIIHRCDKHIEKLRRESGETESPGEYDEVTIVASNQLKQRASIRDRLFEAIKNNPGMKPREYADIIGVSTGTIGRGARELVAMGLIKAVGNTSNRTYHPVA